MNRAPIGIFDSGLGGLTVARAIYQCLPGESTVYVIKGRVEVHAGADSWEGRSGDLLEIPPQRHSLHAIEDSAVLLTVVLRGRG